MDDGTCPQWLAAFAGEVNRTIRQHDAMPVFREMLETWMVDMEAQGDELSVWEKRYTQYVDKVLKTPELRDRKAFHTNPVNGETANGLKWYPLPHCGKDLWCWAPAEFRIRPETRPTYAFPLLPTERCLSKPERYAALAAVHDLCCKGVEKVAPWPKPGQFAERQDEKRYEMYGSLLERIGELNESDLPALKALLDEAEEGLTNSNGSGSALKIQNRANGTRQALVQQTIINPTGNVAGINTGDMTCEDKSGANPKKKSWFKEHWVAFLLAVLAAVIAGLVVHWVTG